MNRKKKVISTLKLRAKKANAKLANNNNKPRYISKAEREKLALAADVDGSVDVVANLDSGDAVDNS